MGGARDHHAHHVHAHGQQGHSHSQQHHSAPHEPSTSSSSGLPPAPTKFDASQAQACRLQDAYWSDDEEDMDCPLCLEEIDLSDVNFKPCPCGYQICRFCWHHIKQNLNGRCPACRRKYSDQTVEFTPMSAEEIKRLTQAKKQKEREKKELEQMNRKHLANMRVVQKNLVYVTGLSSKLAKEELIPTLRSQEYFGQYGRISKILISKRTTASKLVMGMQESAIGVYVTYYRKEDAARAIVAIDGTKGSDGKLIRASYGTTKYCTTYLRNLPCTNPACTYLHEPGEEADSFTKEDLSTLRHAAKDSERKASRPPLMATAVATGSERKDSVSSSSGHHSTHIGGSTAMPASGQAANHTASITLGLNESEGGSSALPKTASWGSTGTGVPPIKPPSLTNGIAITPTGLREQDLPPLSALITQQTSQVQQQQQQQVSKKNKQQQQQQNTTGKKQAAGDAAAAAASVAAAATTSPEPTSSAPASALVPAQKDIAGLADTAKASPQATSAKLTRTDSSRGSSTPVGPPPGLAAPPAATAGEADAKQSKDQKAKDKDKANGKDDALALAQGKEKDSAEDPKSKASGYQPSSKAQALIDDLHQRRSAPVQPSPFPDLDEIVLGSFSNGDFSFNLPDTLASGACTGAGIGSDSIRGFGGVGVGIGSVTGPGMGTALPAFAPFALAGGVGYSAACGLMDLGIGSPMLTAAGGVGAAAHGYGGARRAAAYSGSFDPFASAEDSKGAPFAAIDEMKRNLSDERGIAAAGNGAGGAAGGTTSDDDRAGSDQGKRGSRFSFTRKRDDQGSDNSFATSALNASLPSLTASATSAASSPALDTSPYSNGGRGDSFLNGSNNGSSSAASESQDASTLSRNFMSSVLGLKTDVTNVQEAGHGSSALSNDRPSSAGSHSQPHSGFPAQRSVGPHPQQVANGTRSWQEQQAAQAQQQHTAARMAAYPQAYEQQQQQRQPQQHPRERQQPLLAQLMASASQRRAENGHHVFGMPGQHAFGNGAGLNDMPFYDPSIMSIARGPQQQQQPPHLGAFRPMPGAAAYDFHAPPGFAPRNQTQRPHDRSPFTLS
ncbi:hypothetical protein K437DRAFT_11953 [Tilletiaria anomala UBC 951]|uniref:RING-type domain-containing protein n=1 Tax=Tilletiaria anomala (strain ATCC 24038 / CBS 436.72 / UBC 951) TaxID=1037660 RepID=A0A066VGI3_TILAU|nr:uncharacterized protein K437DRAFT_11953 [Tilletiaria anomala UBC 951]KDN39398.1 hypothetical protein K437DRAFT_11953 [Tilletiaria anomala UBC 951]